MAAPELGSVHGRDMFLVSWDRIIAALSVVFETTEDKKVRPAASLRARVAYVLKEAVGASRGCRRCGSRGVLLPLQEPPASLRARVAYVLK